MGINLEKATLILNLARQRAGNMGLAMSFAIFDEERALITFQRMDGASGLSVILSQSKALTALKLNCDTENVAYLVAKDEGVLRKLRYNDSISLIGGGKLIKDGDVVIGAIGVSGGTEEQDIEIATAAIGEIVSASLGYI